MKNKYIHLAKLITRLLLLGVILLAGIIILLLILWNIDVSFFENIRVLNDGSIFKFTTKPNAQGMPLSEYSNFLFYFTCIRALTVTVAIYLILQTVLKILGSIDSLETFRKDNVKSFQKMGKLFIAWFLLAIPTIRIIDGDLSLSVGFYLMYIVWALICFVLAEIFSEGNKLMEDNKLTI